MVVVAVQLVAMRGVLGLVEHGVRVAAAQRLRNAQYRPARRLVVELFGHGHDLIVRLLMNGVKQFVEALAPLGGNGHDRYAQQRAQSLRVDEAAAPLDLVHLIERDDHGPLELHQLKREIEIALDAGRVDDVEHDVGMMLRDEMARDVLLDAIGREGIHAGQIDKQRLVVPQAEARFLALDGDARPVADILIGTGQRVEQRGFAAVRIAGQSDCDIHGNHPFIRTRLKSVRRIPDAPRKKRGERAALF